MSDISLNALISHILLKYLIEHYDDYYSDIYADTDGKNYQKLHFLNGENIQNKNGIDKCVGTCWHRRSTDQRSLVTCKGDKFPFPLRVQNQNFCMKVRCYDARD